MARQNIIPVQSGSPLNRRGTMRSLLGLIVLVTSLTSCVWPCPDPVGSDGLTDEQWLTLRHNVPLFYDAIGAVTTLLAAEDALVANQGGVLNEDCPMIEADPSGVSNAFVLTYGDDCTLADNFRTPLQGVISTVFGVRSNELDLTYDSLQLDGVLLTGTAGLALSETDEQAQQLTGNFRIAFVDHDDVRGIVTLEHHPDGRLIIRNGFWLYEQNGVEFEVTDPTSNTPNGQIVITPGSSTRLVPEAGRVAFRAAMSRYVVTFNENTPSTGKVNVVIDGGPTLTTTLPTRSLMTDD